ncbi:MAG: FAD:protein FMN transferase [Solirubrobacteraceae bacterium]
MDETESIESFECFGGHVNVIVMGAGPAGTPRAAAAMVKRRMLDWHLQFSRFEPESELSKLNADPRETVPVSPLMARLLEATIGAAQQSGGLVDATLVGEIEAAGYDGHFDAPSLPLRVALALAPPRHPGGPSQRTGWRQVTLDRRALTVTRPAGLRFDSGGIAKGMFGDILAEMLDGHTSFAIDCGGDVRLGGSGRIERPVQVASPFSAEILHTFALHGGAVATSGIGKRSWLDSAGRPAHHLLDPATGLPAYTGIVQVTAIAPTGVEAEWRTKAALLSGPQRASEWLPHGGLVVFDDADVELVTPPR